MVFLCSKRRGADEGIENRTTVSEFSVRRQGKFDRSASGQETGWYGRTSPRRRAIDQSTEGRVELSAVYGRMACDFLGDGARQLLYSMYLLKKTKMIY